MPERKSRRAPALAVTIAALLAASLASASPARAAEIGTVPDITWATSRADVDRTIGLMRDAGVRWVRTNVPWNAIEPNEKGSYNAGYLSDIDYAVAKAREAGIEVLMPISDGVPYWASADPNKAGGKWNRYWRPTSFADYADFVRFVVGRYQSMGVTTFEIWNEPNISLFWPSGVSAAEYVQMLKAGYEAVKEVEPTAQVVLGGLSKSDYAYLEAVYAAGGGPYFDVAAVHPYTGSVDPTWCWGSPRYSKEAFCSIEEVRKTMVAHGDSGKAIWLTEFGWATGSAEYSVSESDQASFLTKALTKLETYPYVTKAFYYNFRNNYWENDDPTELNANFGLLRTDFSAKPAYWALQAFALSLRNTTRAKIRVKRVRATLTASGEARLRVVSGRIVGVRTDGGVKVKLRRYRPALGRWGRGVVRKAPMTSTGAYARNLRLRPGLWRARALYAGTEFHAPSRSRRVQFRVAR